VVLQQLTVATTTIKCSTAALLQCSTALLQLRQRHQRLMMTLILRIIVLLLMMPMPLLLQLLQLDLLFRQYPHDLKDITEVSPSQVFAND
jgi:predicted nucleic acid-binding Zn ribbon protein